jgi:hypothetical protein
VRPPSQSASSPPNSSWCALLATWNRRPGGKTDALDCLNCFEKKARWSWPDTFPKKDSPRSASHPTVVRARKVPKAACCGEIVSAAIKSQRRSCSSWPPHSVSEVFHRLNLSLRVVRSCGKSPLKKYVPKRRQLLHIGAVEMVTEGRQRAAEEGSASQSDCNSIASDVASDWSISSMTPWPTGGLRGS